MRISDAEKTVYDGLIAALAAKGQIVTHAIDTAYGADRPHGVRFDDGLVVRVEVRSRGQFAVTVGDYGNPGRKRFPRPKAGFDFGKVAEQVVKCVEAQRRASEEDYQHGLALNRAAEINAKLGIARTGIAADAERGEVCIKIWAGRLSGPEDKLIALLERAVELGLADTTKGGE